MSKATESTGMTQEEALRRADALVGEALREAETRCSVLAHYISDCESKGARTAAWSVAIRELRMLQDYRAGLLHRRGLIQEAIEYPVGEPPTKRPLPPAPSRDAHRVQQQIQIRARRR
jgi:hypothetical protein